jgi:hypothetical protein
LLGALCWQNGRLHVGHATSSNLGSGPIKEVTLIQSVEQQLFTIVALGQHKIALIAALRSVAVA